MRIITLLLLILVLSACQNATPGMPTPPLTSPLRTRIAFFSQDQTSREIKLYVINPSDGSISPLTNAEITSQPAALSWDGEKIAYENGGDLFVTNIDGGHETQITSFARDQRSRNISSLVWSPDSRQIAFDAGISGYPGYSTVYWITANSRNGITTHSENNLYQGGATWSPDGQKIAYSEIGPYEHDASSRIMIANTDINNPKRLDLNNSYAANDVTGCVENNCPDYVTPGWAPDSKKLAFAGNIGADPDYEIYVINADSTARIKLTDNDAKDQWPFWSPDGRKIAFVSDRSGANGWYVMNADGSQQVFLSEIGMDDYIGTLVWSPDSQKLIFEASRDDGRQLYLIDSNGKNETRLTSMAGYKWGAIWIP